METVSWSNMVKKSPTMPPPKGGELPPQPAVENETPPLCTLPSRDKLVTAVIDANAVIDGAEKLNGIADRFFTIPDVLSEIRDPTSRHRLLIVPFTLDTMEPTPESVSNVIKFAKATGDLQSLSDVDIKVIALTHTLEAQSHGTAHLREAPPPVQTVNVRKLPEKEMPGWGSTDPEWDAIERGDDQEEYTQPNSRVLPMRSLILNSEEQEEENIPNTVEPKTEPNHQERNMGQQDENEDEWTPAVSRSTRRRYLRRKERHELRKQTSVEEELSKALEQVQIEHKAEEEFPSSKTQPITQSTSSVACVTSDFAMQNVILQMGLRLIAPGGNAVKQLHRWVLKCHACFTLTTEIGRIFCPKCGNGGTLRKVAATVDENGVVLAGRKPRVILRGTKFSLPNPRGGREGISTNPILREDQLPQKFVNPKPKKSNKGEEFYTMDGVFGSHCEKNAAFRPPVRQAMSLFGGRRNPNDNHYAIRKR